MYLLSFSWHHHTQSSRPARTSSPKAAFTLVELMVAMVVLVVLLLGVTSLTNSTATITTASSQRGEADEQARVFLDRIQTDLTMMPRRQDLDYQFLKVNGAGAPITGNATTGAAGNDRMFFLSNAPGYSGGMLGSTFGKNVDHFMQQRNSTALVGYMIEERKDSAAFGNFQGRRFGDANLWLNSGSFKSAMALSPQAIDDKGEPNYSFAPDVKTTIFGSFETALIGTPAAPPNLGKSSLLSTTDKLWPILAPGVFRFEFAYLLKDGTYSVKPIISRDAQGNKLHQQYSATKDPTKNSIGYDAGARWWNASDHRAFICTSADVEGTRWTWKPNGFADVAAIIVSIAVLDSRGRTVLNGTDSLNRWKKLMTILPDPQVDAETGELAKGPLETRNVVSGKANTPRLPALVWSRNLGDATILQSVGIPTTVVNQVRVYQRTIYLR